MLCDINVVKIKKNNWKKGNVWAQLYQKDKNSLHRFPKHPQGSGTATIVNQCAVLV